MVSGGFWIKNRVRKMTLFCYFFMIFMKNTDFDHFRCFLDPSVMNSGPISRETVVSDTSKMGKTVVSKGSENVVSKGSKTLKKWSHRGLKVDFD